MLDPKLTGPAVVGRSGKIESLDTDSGVVELKGVRCLEVGEGWTLAKVREHLATHLGDNDIDEAVVRGDNGKLYVVYADDLPASVQPDRRFSSDQIAGTIVDVQREIDAMEIARRAIGHTYGAVLDLAGILAIPETFGGSTVFTALGIATHCATELVAANGHRDTRGLDLIRQQYQPRATDPAAALRRR